MGENEMKPRSGLPCGVRLTAGLGGAGGTTALALAAETAVEPERRDTLSIGAVFTAASVPELSLVQHRFARQSGVVFPAVGVLELRQNETDFARHIRRGALLPESGPPTDGQPPQCSRPHCSQCQRMRWQQGRGSMQHRLSGEEFRGGTEQTVQIGVTRSCWSNARAMLCTWPSFRDCDA